MENLIKNIQNINLNNNDLLDIINQDLNTLITYYIKNNLENIIFEDHPNYHYLSKDNIIYIKYMLFESEYSTNFLIKNSNNLINKIDAIFLINYYNDIIIDYLI